MASPPCGVQWRQNQRERSAFSRNRSHRCRDSVLEQVQKGHVPCSSRPVSPRRSTSPATIFSTSTRLSRSVVSIMPRPKNFAEIRRTRGSQRHYLAVKPLNENIPVSYEVARSYSELRTISSDSRP